MIGFKCVHGVADGTRRMIILTPNKCKEIVWYNLSQKGKGQNLDRIPDPTNDTLIKSMIWLKTSSYLMFYYSHLGLSLSVYSLWK